HYVLLTTIENNQTARVIEELKGVGIGSIFGKLTLSPVDIEINSYIQEKELPRVKKGRGISYDEMIENIRGLALPSFEYIFLSLVAGLLAAFGLIFNNLLIIIASMIIAPLMGPIALSVIGTMLPKNPYRAKALIAEILGLATCCGVGLLVGFLIPLPQNQSEIPEQILIRTKPGLGDIIFAILSGIAASIFIIRGESTSLVGVAVAASLCPPAANIGILIANHEFGSALGSVFLLFLNVVSIYCACAIIFWISQSWVKGGTVSTRQFRKISRKFLLQIAIVICVLIGTIVVILIFF
ncbi:MAG: DUF389 domain-containing protein, partial [Promethearchaeota archaeon]